jgi:hypothetical protein
MPDRTGGMTDGGGQCTSPTPNQEICAAACQWVLLSLSRSEQAGRACERSGTTTSLTLSSKGTYPDWSW